MRVARGCLVLAALLAASAGASSARAAESQGAPDSLIGWWLDFPGLSRVAWPYAYIRAHPGDIVSTADRGELLDELEALRWRLDDANYTALHETVAAWHERVAQTTEVRVPGDFSPAWLMAHPASRPEVGHVEALGACEVPDWIEIWDRAGIRRIPWQGGLALSDLRHGEQAVDTGGAARVSVVGLYGEVTEYGVQAWNFSDAELPPGARIVAELPLDGQVVPWLRSAIANFLAHSKPGDDCREIVAEPAAGAN
ncbi:hypothetical protein [Salinisphaera orenii]|uniref:Capsule biosynthesis GfcC-like C-terminal domain-containing protein n=1 Tax=Salinisphaera orenii YIM 95161 TaxID=1051139 RepID=A0A423Q276_9GAMM|nr:hypothetical protein [Salinisphaera halophila]ROO32519.1 hypothetical protein SAHL_05090 [Salinisphaera halophila YIM 95161]